VFVSSHLMSEMAMTATRLVVVGRGRLIADTTVEEFVARAGGNAVTVRTPEAAQLRDLLLGPDISVTSEQSGVLDVQGLTAEQIGTTAWQARLPVFELTTQHASLEEAKDAPPAELLSAVRTVAAGDAVLAPSATRRLIDQFAPLLPDPGRQHDQDVLLSQLTDRERTVFAQLAAGRSNREIAAALHLSEGTVKIHVGRILAKLDLRDRVQAVVLAYESGLITPGG
jgi:DNA-binding CsgD family transcriptional regulator